MILLNTYSVFLLFSNLILIQSSDDEDKATVLMRDKSQKAKSPQSKRHAKFMQVLPDSNPQEAANSRPSSIPSQVSQEENPYSVSKPLLPSSGSQDASGYADSELLYHGQPGDDNPYSVSPYLLQAPVPPKLLQALGSQDDNPYSVSPYLLQDPGSQDDNPYSVSPYLLQAPGSQDASVYADSELLYHGQSEKSQENKYHQRPALSEEDELIILFQMKRNRYKKYLKHFSKEVEIQQLSDSVIIPYLSVDKKVIGTINGDLFINCLKGSVTVEYFTSNLYEDVSYAEITDYSGDLIIGCLFGNLIVKAINGELIIGTDQQSILEIEGQAENYKLKYNNGPPKFAEEHYANFDRLLEVYQTTKIQKENNE